MNEVVKKIKDGAKKALPALALATVLNFTGCATLQNPPAAPEYIPTEKELNFDGINIRAGNDQIQAAERLGKVLNKMEKSAPLIISALKEHGTKLELAGFQSDSFMGDQSGVVAMYRQGRNEIKVNPQFDRYKWGKDKLVAGDIDSIAAILISHETIHMLQDKAGILNNFTKLKPSERASAVNFTEMDATIKGYIYNHTAEFKDISARDALLEEVAQEWYGYEPYAKENVFFNTVISYVPNDKGVTFEGIMSDIAAVGDPNTYSPEALKSATETIKSKTIQSSQSLKDREKLQNADKRWEKEKRASELTYMNNQGKITDEEYQIRLKEIYQPIAKNKSESEIEL